MGTSELVLERRSGLTTEAAVLPLGGGGVVMITPPLDEDYWEYRVKLSETQAIVGFPKFMTIGIGFAEEEDWNTNLPYSSPANEIFDHIIHNKGDEGIADADVLKAIEMVRSAAQADREKVAG